MGRGKFLSRKDAPPSTRPTEDLERSSNPLVKLGLAFKKVQKLAPASSLSLPSSSGLEDGTSKRPLVDINDVRKFLREKLAIKKDISTIPVPDSFSPSLATHHSHFPVANTSSETTHVSSEHSFSSSPSSLPSHDAASGARVFDIGTVGHPILEADEQRGDQSGIEQPTMKYSWFVEPPASRGAGASVEMEDVQEFFRNVAVVVGRIQRWGLPETSWINKMPWHSPPPKILARGLQWPPRSFASDEERLRFNRNARRRRGFLTGCPPTWSFMVANFALMAFLVYNPLG